MQIISIALKKAPQGMPQHFVVGQPPLFRYNEDGTMAGNEVPDCPAVSKIAFPAVDLPRRAFDGRCYVIQFENSDMRRIVPADLIADIAYVGNSTKAVPELPNQ